MNFLKHFREQKGLTLKELAEASDFGVSTINNFENGKTEASDRFLKVMAKTLGVTPEEILHGKADKKSRRPEALTPPERQPTSRHGHGPYWGTRKEVPILGPVSAGGGCEVIDNEADYPHIPSDTKDANAYAVYVEGDSMEPTYKAGDILVVEPNSPPQPGQYTIAKTSDHDVYFKLFQRSGRNGEIIRLVSLNPLYPAMEFDGTGLIWCHRVRSVYRLLVQPNKE